MIVTFAAVGLLITIGAVLAAAGAPPIVAELRLVIALLGLVMFGLALCASGLGDIIKRLKADPPRRDATLEREDPPLTRRRVGPPV